MSTSLVDLYKTLGGGWDPQATRSLEEYVPTEEQEQMKERTKAWRKVLQ